MGKLVLYQKIRMQGGKDRLLALGELPYDNHVLIQIRALDFIDYMVIGRGRLHLKVLKVVELPFDDETMIITEINETKQSFS